MLWAIFPVTVGQGDTRLCENLRHCRRYHRMTSERPYRAAKSHMEAFFAISREAGKQSDPFLVGIFQQCGAGFSRYLDEIPAERMPQVEAAVELTASREAQALTS